MRERKGFLRCRGFRCFWGEEPDTSRKGWRFGEVVGAAFDCSVFDLAGEPMGDGEGGRVES